MQRKRMMLAILLALCTTAGITQEATGLMHADSWQQVLDKAKASDKLIFVDTYFTGCHPCAQMDKEVFPTPFVKQALANDFVAVKVDVFKEKLGDSINKKYAITGFPTFLILNSDGRLLKRFSGFTDAGLLLKAMEDAKTMAKAGKYLAGFSASVNESYPDFYLKFFDRSAEPLPPQVANDWLAKQQDFSKETVAIPLLMTRKLDSALQQVLLENYSMFRGRFGQELVLGKAADLLHAQLSKAVGNVANEGAFREFLQTQAPLFPAEDWQIIRFTTGFHYYGSVAKDTLALLRFVNEQPLVYVNYMGALYNNMVVRKQLNAEAQALFCQWAQKAVNENSALDAMSSAANWCQRNGDTEGYKRFMQMALNKAKACGMEASRYEKSLVAK